MSLPRASAAGPCTRQGLGETATAACTVTVLVLLLMPIPISMVTPMHAPVQPVQAPPCPAGSPADGPAPRMRAGCAGLLLACTPLACLLAMQPCACPQLQAPGASMGVVIFQAFDVGRMEELAHGCHTNLKAIAAAGQEGACGAGGGQEGRVQRL